jgi:hemerythrin
VNIDEQHKQLIYKLNELVAAMKQQRGRAEVEAILNFLEGYVKVHFSDEEHSMEAYHCPLAETNRRAHAKFTETFYSLRNQFQNEGPSAALAIAIQRDLMDWLVNHIRQVDTSLHSCVQGSAVSHVGSVVRSNGHRPNR